MDLDGVQPQLRGLPLLEGLEDERDGAEVGLVELLQHLLVLGFWVLGFLGGGGWVVWGGEWGRTDDQAAHLLTRTYNIHPQSQVPTCTALSCGPARYIAPPPKKISHTHTHIYY